MKHILLIIPLLLAPILPVQATEQLTLDEAVTTALKNHPQMVEAAENLDGATARTGQAQANYYPQISIVADWSKGRTFLTALEKIRTTEVNTEVISLKQTIYDFGRTAAAVAAARHQQEAVVKARAMTRNDLIFRVKSAYYLLLAAEKQAIATRETVHAREAVYHQAQEFFTQGIRPKVEVTKAEASLLTARTALIRAENNIEIARLELAGAMGAATLDERSLMEPSASVVPVPERSQVRQEALRKRPELGQLSALQSAAAANLKSARSSYLPVLSGTASFGYADRDFPPSGTVWGGGLNLTLPIFSGFSSLGQVQEAAANLNSLEARLSNLKLQVIKETESAWLACHEAEARITSSAQEAAAAEENRALAEGRYHEGVGNIIEVTDAQVLALEARTAQIQARYDFGTALARLDRAIGNQGTDEIKE